MSRGLRSKVSILSNNFQPSAFGFKEFQQKNRLTQKVKGSPTEIRRIFMTQSKLTRKQSRLCFIFFA